MVTNLLIANNIMLICEWMRMLRIYEIRMCKIIKKKTAATDFTDLHSRFLSTDLKKKIMNL